jgi:hypothetical protein
VREAIRKPSQNQPGPTHRRKNQACTVTHARLKMEVTLLDGVWNRRPSSFPLFHMLPDKYIGLILAVSSSFFIGFSFTLTKRGLMNTKKVHGKSTFYCILHFSFIGGRGSWLLPSPLDRFTLENACLKGPINLDQPSFSTIDILLHGCYWRLGGSFGKGFDTVLGLGYGQYVPDLPAHKLDRHSTLAQKWVQWGIMHHFDIGLVWFELGWVATSWQRRERWRSETDQSLKPMRRKYFIIIFSLLLFFLFYYFTDSLTFWIHLCRTFCFRWETSLSKELDVVGWHVNK